MSEDNETQIRAITAVLQPTLHALDVLTHVARYLHPPNIPALAESVVEVEGKLREGLAEFSGVRWPDELGPFADRIDLAARETGESLVGLQAAVGDPESVFRAYRSLRHMTSALEALYPLTRMLPPVSRFFLDPGQRDDVELLKKLFEADHERDNVGIMNANNDKKTRGGFTLYVPEYYDPDQSYPLIMAMHGGSGHGADFLWSWLREARGRGCILISPTALGTTWSLMGPDQDSTNLDKMVDYVCEGWNVDRTRLLLTGMSDGGTFSFVSGLRAESPFTHLAPSSASFHPMLVPGLSDERIQGLPIYLMHGALDWMFPVEVAREASQALSERGAEVVYREIDDLSHTYPRDENPRILDWLFGEGPQAA